MKKSLFLVGASLLALNISTEAQNRGNRNNNGGNNNGANRNNGGGNNGGATFPLPEGVESVVSIDAYNILMAQTNRDGKRDLSPIIVRHIYSGGVARLFGGSTIPTEQFVSPGTFGGGNNGGGQNGGGQNNGFGGGVQGGGNLGGAAGGLGGAQTGGAFQMRRRASAFRGRN